MKKPQIIFLGFVVLVALLGVCGQWLNPWLSWDRSAISEFQLWRLVSGHLVHTNLFHTGMNLSVLAASAYLFGNCFSPKNWAIVFLLLCVCDSVALYFLSPWLINYVGLSGVLYGVLALGFLKNFDNNPVLHTIVLALITGKIVWEQLPGFDANYLRSQIDAAVIVDAHLYGFFCGVAFYLIYRIWGKVMYGR